MGRKTLDLILHLVAGRDQSMRVSDGSILAA